MAKGNSSSVYATAQPNRISLADTIVKQEQLDNQRRQQQRQEAQFAYQQQKDEKAERAQKSKDFWSNVKKFDMSADDPHIALFTDLGYKAMDVQLKLYKDLMNGVGDPGEIRMHQEKLNMLGSRLKASLNGFNTVYKDLSDKLSKGEIVETDELKRFMKGLGQGQASMRLNDDMSYDFIYDADGDGVLDVITEKELSGMTFAPNTIKKIDVNSTASAFSKNVGMEHKKWTEGVRDRETMFPKEDMINSQVDAFFSDNENVRGLLYAAGVEDYMFPDDETVNLYRDQMANLVRGNLKTTNFDEVNQTAMNRLQSAKDAANKVTETSKSIGEAVEPLKETWGGYFDSIPKGVKSIPVADSKAKFEALKSGKKTHQNFVVNNFTYDKDGTILLYGSENSTIGDGEEPDFTKLNFGSKKVERLRVKGNAEIESRLAKMLKTTVKDMRDQAGFTEQNMSDSDSDTGFDPSKF